MAFHEAGENRKMRHSATMGLAGLLAVLALITAAGASSPGPTPGAAAGPDFKFPESNIERVRRFLDETAGTGLGDYVFVLIGDPQNSVRDLGRPVFNAIARNLYESVDPKTGERLYDRVRFVIINGDMVDEGPSLRQWQAFDDALRGKGADGTSYPYLAMLIKDKPVFPTIGNHELMDFRLRTQTKYDDLFGSPKGVARFKAFFDWDRWIADPRILYPVPADVPEAAFRAILGTLDDPAEREFLEGQYVLKPDGRRHLRFFEDSPLDAAAMRSGKDALAPRLAGIFRKAGYGTLPVLNSDNMIGYAFEAGKVVYLFLDSMSRGWQYPNFARLKKALYPEDKDQHRLNLASLSPFNGQADFFHAVADYARARGLTVVPLLHHSFFNLSRDPYRTGVEYNSWLALGLPHTPGEKGDPTLVDEIVFSDIPVVFSSCIHRFEAFSIVARAPGRPDHVLRWYVSGGGHGSSGAGNPVDRSKVRQDLYNGKLAAAPGEPAGRTIEVRDKEERNGGHYLIVHVKDGRIVDVSPRFLATEETERPTFRPQLTLGASYSFEPDTAGAGLEFSPGYWGLEKLAHYLEFINWRPSVAVGFAHYNVWKSSGDISDYAATFELSPFTAELHIPRANILTLRPLAFEYWDAGGALHRAFLTTGLEIPVLYDLFGRLDRLTFGFKVYFPLGAGAGADPDFGARMKLAFSVGYRVRL
jgi:hypothetical protein